jgi:hypothetical protein
MFNGFWLSKIACSIGSSVRVLADVGVLNKSTHSENSEEEKSLAERGKKWNG